MRCPQVWEVWSVDQWCYRVWEVLKPLGFLGVERLVTS